MDYTVVRTRDQWGFELRDPYGKYVGNAVTLEQAQRFAEAEGGRLHFDTVSDRGGPAGDVPIWTDWLRALAGRLRPAVEA
jgi:hypothetical protein